MTPRLALDNVPDISAREVGVNLRDITETGAGIKKKPHIKDLLLGRLSQAIIYASPDCFGMSVGAIPNAECPTISSASLLPHILHICLLRAKKEMVRCATGASVTGMQYAEMQRVDSGGNEISEPVGLEANSLDIKLAVSRPIQSPFPWPAFFWSALIDIGPKAIYVFLTQCRYRPEFNWHYRHYNTMKDCYGG